MNRSHLLLAGLLLAAPLAGLTPVRAATAPNGASFPQRMEHGQARHRHHGIENMDADHDGRVSRAEFDAGIARHASHQTQGRSASRGLPDFAAIDRNHDGYVVASEVRAYREQVRPQREAEHRARFEAHFAQTDLNHDGRLGRVEVSEKSPRLERRFAWLDENRDGFLSRAEVQAARRDHH
ncbi:MAG: EF-hand domain-containing protein [Luteimonas sp.]